MAVRRILHLPDPALKRVAVEVTPGQWELVDRVAEIAVEKKVTPAQLALAWVLAQGADVVPIPGTTKASHLEQNLKALEIELTSDDLSRIEQAFPRGLTAGKRYPDMSTVNR